MSRRLPLSHEHTLARLIFGQVCIHASMSAMRMAAPLLALHRGYGPMAVGGLLALFSLTQVFLAIPAGRFADRHGLRLPVRLSVGVAVAGTSLAVLWPQFAALALAALCLGGASGAASIALQRHVGRSATSPLALKKAFGWLASGPALSNFLGPVAAGLLIDHAGQWLGATAAEDAGFRAAFGFSMLLPLLSLWWIHPVPELPPVAAIHGQEELHPLSLLRDALLRRLLLVNWLLSSCWDVHTFVVPVLGHERGLSASAIGSILGGFAVAATAVRLLMPLMAAHLREWVVVTLSMLSTACLFAVYPLLDSAWAMGLCSVLLGMSLGGVQPMIMSTLHQITPEAHHGKALGLRLMSINLSSVVMPVLFGSAGLVLGVSVVFWTVGLAVGLGARLAWGLRPQTPGHAG